MLNREEIKNLPQLLTPQELAEAMGISLPFCYKLIRSKGFPSFRVGKKWLISTDRLMEWIDLQADSKLSRVEVRMTPEEKENLKNKAEEAHMTVSKYIVYLSETKSVILIDDIAKLTVEITRQRR